MEAYIGDFTVSSKYRNVTELCSNEIFILENEDTPT